MKRDETLQVSIPDSVTGTRFPALPHHQKDSVFHAASGLARLTFAYHAVQGVFLCMSKSPPDTKAGAAVSIDILWSLQALSAKREGKQGKEVWKNPGLLGTYKRQRLARSPTNPGNSCMVIAALVFVFGSIPVMNLARNLV